MAKLFLIPTTLSSIIDHNVITQHQLAKIKHLKYFIVETAKIGRQHIKQLQLNNPLQKLEIKELNKYNNDYQMLIQPLVNGYDVGLLSDCGLPAVADPGSEIVKLCHQNNIQVIPLSGSSSLMLTLMASGANGQSFAFQGYLPIDKNKCRIKIKQLEKLIIDYNQTQILIETPFRNEQLFDELIKTLNKNIILTIGINLMDETQQIISQSIAKWNNCDLPCLNKQEVVFVLGN